MGVKWLTTYVREVERIVSSEVTFEVQKDVSTATVPSASPNHPTFVVDAWALIFQIWLNEHGDAVRELDYEAYQQSLTTILSAWQSTGAVVVMVFDGPQLPSKGPTIVARRNGTAVSNAAYMKSSPASRTSRRFQRECGIVPPLLYFATISAVESMRSKQVEMVFAPTEADSLVAEIATGKEQGYAISLDSDYFILCARGRGCHYVPLDSFQYLVDVAASEEVVKKTIAQDAPADDSDGFQAVGRRKKGGRRSDAFPSVKQVAEIAFRQTRSLAPPPGSDEKLKSISFRAYRPHDLAAHLHIPPTLLPVLAALVGNDYTKSIQSNLLFRQLQGPKRITEAATLLRNEWLRVTNESKVGLWEATKASAGTRRGHARLQMTMSTTDTFDDGKSDGFSSPSSATATPTRNTPGPFRSQTPVNALDPVRAMVSSIVDKSIDQTDAALPNARYVSTGEKELITDSVIESVSTYSLLTHSDAPHLASPAALFFGHPSSLLTADSSETIASSEALERYRQAYAQGRFKESLIEAMSLRSFLTALSPEDPDVQGVQVTAARELRHWLWAVLFEVWGMSWARKEWDEPSESEEEDTEDEAVTSMTTDLARLDKGYREGEKPDDVISVDTESSHSISQEGENGVDVEDELDLLPTRPGSVAELRNSVRKPPPGIVEIVRKGQGLVLELVQIIPLIDVLNGAAESRTAAAGMNSDRVELPASLAQVRGQHEASQERPEGVTDNEPSSDPIPPPIVLMSLNVRLDFYLHAHRACTPQIQALPQSWWPTAAILRLSICHEADRLGPAKKKANWTRGEIMAAIQSIANNKKISSSSSSPAAAAVETAIKDVYPSTRAIHLGSTIQLLLTTSTLVAQALLIPLDIPAWPAPQTLFHGPTFHLKMQDVADEIKLVEDALTKEERTVFKAVVHGIEDNLGMDISELRKERKAKKKEAKEAQIRAAEAAPSANVPASSSLLSNNKTNGQARRQTAVRNSLPLSKNRWSEQICTDRPVNGMNAIFV